MVTSKLLRAPLQKNDMVESSAETGFPSLPWDYDMDDELLELLITKARLFEAQIRYAINGPLVAIEVADPVQLIKLSSSTCTPWVLCIVPFRCRLQK